MKHFEDTRRLLENSNFYYIITTGMDGNYSYINRHYAKSFSYLSDTLIGRPYYITMHPDDRETCVEVSAKCFAHPEKLFPATIRKHDGKGGYIITQWEYKALWDEDNNPAGIFCLGHDITRYMDEKQQLQEAETEIERKADLLRKIAFQQSHLIRAPLSNVLGLADILGKTEADNNVSNICKMILQSSQQLDEVIRTIVNLTYLSNNTNEDESSVANGFAAVTVNVQQR